MGFSGSQTHNWTASANPYDPLLLLPQLAPDLTIINLGLNDLGNGIPVSTSIANVQAIITAALKTGDVILVVPNHINPDSSNEPAYVSSLYGLAQQNNLPLFDLTIVLGPYSLAQANGFMFDSTHPSGPGYAKIADGLSQMVNSQ